MNRWQYWLLGIGLLPALAGAALFLVSPITAASPQEVSSPPATIYDHGLFVAPALNVEHGAYAAPMRDHMQMARVGCEVTAVSLIGAWVDAGVPEGDFPFESLNGEACTGDFAADVLPLFTTEDVWFEGSQACTECHFDNSEDSRHEMDLSSYEGIMRGGDVLSEPPGVQIVIPGDWSNSKLRARLRNNRMPPGWEFDIEETNRDGPLLNHAGGDVYAVNLIGAWVDAGAAEGAFAWTDKAGTEHEGDFEADVLPLFTTEDIWFEGSQACIECHFDNSEDSRHEMDLSSYDGIMMGGDVLSEPPGVAIVEPGNWGDSKLRARLRNNRMPPGWEFDIEETNRDGPMISAGSRVEPMLLAGDACGVYAVDLIGAWVDAGVPEGAFSFVDVDGNACESDFKTAVLPLFTEENTWFEGSQACTECHFDNSEDSRHEMDLSSYEGIMKGGDVLSEPPGVQIVIPGNWSDSKLRARLRNNRMPPGWEFDIEETNRDGPLMNLNGGDIYAVDLIGAWVDAGLSEGAFAWTDEAGNEHEGNFEADVLPLFSTEDIWFEGSQACTECHFDNSEDSRHEMDLSSYDGIMKGGDVLSEPPGVPIVIAGNWGDSKLRARLRNNRMPPGWEFDIEETNRDGPMIFVGTPSGAASAVMTAGTVLSGDCSVYAVDLIGAWVDAGATESDVFTFVGEDGRNCQGEFGTDVLPLFTEENAWFSGSQACVECHFDNSEDSRHEMDLSSYEGMMRGGDVLSEPPGVPIILPGNWGDSKLRARLRNNRMPPGWEFDIEETNRDGPLMSLDDGDIYAVDLIGAWVDAGLPDGAFVWTDVDGSEHEGDFDADVLPLFTTENIWFEGSQACTECHFDNSEDSRHEMDLSSYDGIMLGGDVLSEPPGVPIVIGGNWSDSKLRARLRNNRMPPGWEFDIEETNRDGPLVTAGTAGEEAAAPESSVGDGSTGTTLAAGAPAPPPPPEIPDPTITESVASPFIEPMFLALLGGLTIVFGIVLAVVMANRLRAKDRQPGGLLMAVDVSLLLFTLLAVGTGGLALHAGITDELTTVRTIHEEVPFVVEVAAVAPTVPRERLEEWQASIPEEYSGLENPFIGDADAVSTGQDLYFDHNCYHCHGGKLDGDGEFSPGLTPKPVNLTDPALMDLPFMTDNYLYWRISEGGANPPFLSAMPAWHSILTEDERWQLVTYIRSQTSDVVFDDGEQAAIAIVEKAGCFACHRSEVLGRGGKIGPPWDEVAAAAGGRVPGMDAAAYVRDSIVNPRNFIAPGFEDQAETMPPDFGERLSEEEIDILVEFLLHLGAEDGSH